MLFTVSMACAGIGFAFMFGDDIQSAKLCAMGCAIFLFADGLTGKPCRRSRHLTGRR